LYQTAVSQKGPSLPPGRVKMFKPHRVALSTEALAIIDEIQRQISEAEAREMAKALETSSAEAKNAKARLDQLGDQLTDMATALATKIGEAEKTIADIRARNKKFVADGRPDLQIKVPDITLWKRDLSAYVR
jgi:hypothetical protein